MGSRAELQEVLQSLDNVNLHVYFQPPPSVAMDYPAIVYSRNGIDNISANNEVYIQEKSYKVVVIDRHPDSKYVDLVSKLPKCTFNTHYTADNLNHDVFTLYY